MTEDVTLATKHLTREPTDRTIVGRALAPGLVIGGAFIYREPSEAPAEPDDIESHQIAEELQRLDRAMGTVRDDLRVSAHRIEADTDAKLGAIFQAHEAMLQDPSLQQEIRAAVEGELISATSEIEIELNFGISCDVY